MGPLSGQVIRRRALASGAFGIALLAFVYMASRSKPIQEPSERAVPSDSVRIETPTVSPAATTVIAGRVPAAERVAADLRSMSQTFRNDSFLIAIRGAGFYCDNVVSAVESTNGVWLASCANQLGYAVGALDVNRFDVHPVALYFDGVTPAVLINRDAPLERRENDRFR